MNSQSDVTLRNTRTLESLTKGTEEFTEALIKANEEARKLILLGNLTPNDYFIDENRTIIFT